MEIYRKENHRGNKVDTLISDNGSVIVREADKPSWNLEDTRRSIQELNRQIEGMPKKSVRNIRDSFIQ